MTKVLFVSHDAGVYGATRSLIDLIVGLQSLGVDCTLLLPESGEVVQICLKENIKYYIVPYKSWTLKESSNNNLTYKLRLLKYKIQKQLINLKTLIKLRNYVLNGNFDFIYSNTSTVPIGVCLSKLCKIKHIWHIREFGLLDHKLKFDFGTNAFAFLFNKSEGKIFISKALKDYYKSFCNVSGSKVIYNGIKVQDKRLGRIRSCNESFTFLFVGQIKESKGIFDALYAFNLLNKESKIAKLIFVGGGDTESLDDTIKLLGLQDSVSIVGHTLSVTDYYKNSDVLLMCSKNEAFGRVTIEAMSYSLPVLGFNNAGTKEIILHNYNGFLYNSIDELTSYMKLLLNDSSLIDTLGRNAYNYVSSNFDISVYSKSVLDYMMHLKN